MSLLTHLLNFHFLPLYQHWRLFLTIITCLHQTLPNIVFCKKFFNIHNSIVNVFITFLIDWDGDDRDSFLFFIICKMMKLGKLTFTVCLTWTLIVTKTSLTTALVTRPDWTDCDHYRYKSLLCLCCLSLLLWLGIILYNINDQNQFGLSRNLFCLSMSMQFAGTHTRKRIIFPSMKA